MRSSLAPEPFSSPPVSFETSSFIQFPYAEVEKNEIFLCTGFFNFKKFEL